MRLLCVRMVFSDTMSSSAVRVAWEAPVAREAILGYEVAVEGAEPLTTTTTEVTLENLEAGEVRLSGQVDSLSYEESAKSQGSFLQRLFR